MNTRLPEMIADRVVEHVKLAKELAGEQFDAPPPMLVQADDEVFYNLFLMRQAEYGPDLARAFDAKKPDGTDLVPGGRNLLRRFLRIKAEREMAAMWRREMVAMRQAMPAVESEEY